MNASTVVLCVMTTVAVTLTAGCNEKCKHHQISTDDWSDRCLEYEASGGARPGDERRPAVFGSTSGRGPSRSDDEVETPPGPDGGSLRSSRDPRLDHPVGADVTLPRSTAPAGPNKAGVSVHVHR